MPEAADLTELCARAVEAATNGEEVEAYGPPDPASLFDDVYAELPAHLAEQRDLLEKTRRTHHRKQPGSGT